MAVKCCSVKDCDSPVSVRGWCKKHYARWHRHGNPLTLLSISGRQQKHGACPRAKPKSEYTAYTSAKGRCNNPNNNRYKDYGGRGIEFRFTDFEEFYAEVGDKPSPKHSLDRIDNDGHYEKGNVRWATPIEQGRNRQKVRLITFRGETQNHYTWKQTHCKEVRRVENGWCVECAFTNPTGTTCPHK